MTRFFSRAAIVVGVLIAAAVITRALAPAERATGNRMAAAMSRPAPQGALTAAAAYVVAVDTVDASRPHGDLTDLRKVALPVLAAAVGAARPEFTAAQLAVGTAQHARAVTVEGRTTQHGAVVTVTAALTITSRNGDSLRTATAITLTVANTATGWRVSGVRS
jgi:hypothetical protein